MTTSQYLKHFQKLVDGIERVGGSVGTEKSLFESYVKRNDIDITTADLGKIKIAAQQSYLATAFIVSSDKSRYIGLVIKLENDYLLKINSYPQTLTAACNLLNNWK